MGLIGDTFRSLNVMDAFYSSEQSFVIVEILASNDLRFDF